MSSSSGHWQDRKSEIFSVNLIELNLTRNAISAYFYNAQDELKSNKKL